MKAAPQLSGAVRDQLRDLGFKKSEFEIHLLQLDAPGATGLETIEFVFAPRSSGLETVEFLFAPNPGEPPKPLRSIASSGEISRVMLAVKSALADQDAVPLLVFDEIDANVGGEIAHAVAAKMRSLGDTASGARASRTCRRSPRRPARITSSPRNSPKSGPIPA